MSVKASCCGCRHQDRKTPCDYVEIGVDAEDYCFMIKTSRSTDQDIINRERELFTRRSRQKLEEKRGCTKGTGSLVHSFFILCSKEDNYFIWSEINGIMIRIDR